jgi:hypothetical protein
MPPPAIAPDHERPGAIRSRFQPEPCKVLGRGPKSSLEACRRGTPHPVSPLWRHAEPEFDLNRQMEQEGHEDHEGFQRNARVPTLTRPVTRPLAVLGLIY